MPAVEAAGDGPVPVTEEEAEAEAAWILSTNLGIQRYLMVSLNCLLLTSHLSCLACF